MSVRVLLSTGWQCICFGDSSSCDCYALKKTAQDNKSSFSVEAVDTIKDNFHVDDCLKSIPTEGQAIVLCKQFKTVGWLNGSATNHSVLALIQEAERVKEVKNLNSEKEHLPLEWALRVQWCVEEETFKFQVAMNNQSFTRRGILCIVSSVYDLLGFRALFIFTTKHILHELCKLNYGWDDEIPEA